MDNYAKMGYVFVVKTFKHADLMNLKDLCLNRSTVDRSNGGRLSAG